MKPLKLNQPFLTIFELAAELAHATESDAILLLVDAPTDWQALRSAAPQLPIVVVADSDAQVAGASEAGLSTVLRDMTGLPVQEKLAQALLESVAHGNTRLAR